MVTPRTICARDCRATPWKNGQGTTIELAVEPPDASLDTFAWRVSVAELRGSGPFSSFPGYERVIVQLDGPPMALTHNRQAPVQLESLVPHWFSGDDETDCIVAGVAHDFNLIVHRDVALPGVSVHELETDELLARDHDAASVVHVLEGNLIGMDGGLLAAGDTRIDRAGELPPYVAGSEALVLVASLMAHD